MLPVASCEPGAVCLQLLENEIVGAPRVFSAVTVKAPGPIVTSMIHTRQEILGGRGLFPVSCIGAGQANGLLPPLEPQVTLRTPDVPVVFGTPLLTLLVNC